VQLREEAHKRAQEHRGLKEQGQRGSTQGLCQEQQGEGLEGQGGL